jgi:hypothetical protein
MLTLSIIIIVKKGSSYLFTRLKILFYKIFQMQLSYWELRFTKVDYTVVVGRNVHAFALALWKVKY